MKNFIMLFTEKEGTSAMMRLLDEFDQVSVVHQVEDKGWEPFDWHNSGTMNLGDLVSCLNQIYSDSPLDLNSLNSLYLKSAHYPLDYFDKSKSVGFKMRYRPPKNIFRRPNQLKWRETVARIYRQPFIPYFRKVFDQALLDNDVVVFFAVRQDVLRWALSSYHGDGKGGKGHLQFDVAAGKVDPNALPKIYVDPEQFDKEIIRCERQHQKRKKLFDRLKSKGIRCYPVTYEDFVENKEDFFRKIFDALEVNVSNDEIASRINKEVKVRKVHSSEISSFVENHEEILQKFGDRFVSWA